MMAVAEGLGTVLIPSRRGLDSVAHPQRCIHKVKQWRPQRAYERFIRADGPRYNTNIIIYIIANIDISTRITILNIVKQFPQLDLIQKINILKN